MVKAIQYIYQAKAGGLSDAKIVDNLNRDPAAWKPRKGKRNQSGGWRKSYVTKILNTRAVIGEFQPMGQMDGQRMPVGEPIPGYYPPIIDPDLFHQVQSIIKANGQLNGRGGGRTGKASNLFVHLVKCGLCGSPMHFIDKGKPPKGGTYLHCDQARRLHTCSARMVRYDEFEQLFFQNFEELDLSAIIPGEEETTARQSELTRTIAAHNHRVTDLEAEAANIMDQMARTPDARVRDLLEKKLTDKLDEQAGINLSLAQTNKEVTELTHTRATLVNDIDRTREVYSLLASAQDESEATGYRLRLRGEIRRIVDQIGIIPLQEPYVPMAEMDEPGLVKHMTSRSMDRVRIRFKGTRDLRILLLTRYGEIE